MKVLHIISLGLVSLLMAMLIFIGGALIFGSIQKEEAPEPEPESQVVEDTLIKTPFGTITVQREASEGSEPDISSDGHFKLKLGSYNFELGFNAGKEDESQAEPEESDDDFWERLSTRAKKAWNALVGAE